MRAVYPDHVGTVERGGVDIAYEVYENDGPTILLVPTATILHSRQWKTQIPYLSRHFRVISYDGRGNGRSGAPDTVAAYLDAEFHADILAVMDATKTPSAVHIAYCHTVPWSIHTAVHHPHRVSALVAIAPGVEHLAPPMPHYVRAAAHFEEEVEAPQGWEMLNRRFFLANYSAYTRFFFTQMHPESHTTKLKEDSVEWSLGRTPETALLEREARARSALSEEETLAMCRAVTQPTLVVHGDLDQCQSIDRGRSLAEVTGSELVVFEGVGHAPQAREPVRFNLLIKDFVDRVVPMKVVPA